MSGEGKAVLTVEGKSTDVVVKRLTAQDFAKLKGKLRPAVLHTRLQEVQLLDRIPDEFVARTQGLATSGVLQSTL